MSLEYYLFCKKEYDIIISYLEGIIFRYKLMSDIKISESNIDFKHYIGFKPDYYETFFSDILKEIKQSKEICYKKIISMCEHEYVEDYIDITPDRSDRIIYCEICEHTKDPSSLSS